MKRTILLAAVSPFVFCLCLLLLSFTSVSAFELEGLIEPSETVEVSSQVPGVIDVIEVERGDQVKSGQTVARLKSGVEKAAIDLAQARVEFGERKAERNEELFQKKLISAHERDEIATELMIARLELKESEERYNLRVIKSPVDGVVSERSLGPAEYVGENSILTIARIDPLYVEVFVPVSYLGQVNPGMQVKVIPEPPVGGEYLAEVIVVDKVIDAASGTFGVRIELENAGNVLPAGLRCKVVSLEGDIQPCGVSSTKTGKTYMVNGTGINVRNGPGTSYEKIVDQKATQVANDTQYITIDNSVTVYEECSQDGWSKVRVTDPTYLSLTHRGWVASEFLGGEQ